MIRQTTQLRTLLSRGDAVVAVECLSAMTGSIVERAGAEVAYVGGSALGNFHLGVPDHGLLTTTEMIGFASMITNVLGIPLIADGDQGGETALNTRRTIQGLEHVGVAGVHIEDTVNPKHMYEGDSLVPIPEIQVRLAAAVDARRDPDFVIIGRSDVLFNGGSTEEAIERGIAFAEAGADAYMVISMKPDEMAEICQAVPIPVVDINVPRALQESTGLRLNIHTGAAIPHALRAHRLWVESVLAEGVTDFRGIADEYQVLRDVVDEEGVWLPLSREWAAARPVRTGSL